MSEPHPISISEIKTHKHELLEQIKAELERKQPVSQFNELSVIIDAKREAINDLKQIERYAEEINNKIVDGYNKKKELKHQERLLQSVACFPSTKIAIDDLASRILNKDLGDGPLAELNKHIEVYKEFNDDFGLALFKQEQDELWAKFSQLFDFLCDVLIQDPENSTLKATLLSLRQFQQQRTSGTEGLKIVESFENYVRLTKIELNDRMLSLNNFISSFNSEEHYTFIFENYVYELNLHLDNIIDVAAVGAGEPPKSLLKRVISVFQQSCVYLLDKFHEFFEIDVKTFPDKYKELFIVINNPYKHSSSGMPIEKPEIQKIEVFLLEFSKIIGLVSMAVEKLQAIGVQSDLNDFYVLKSNDLRLVSEIYLRLCLSLFVRENRILPFIFYSLKEKDAGFDCFRTIMKSSFAVVDTFSANLKEFEVRHDDLDFYSVTEWIDDLFKSYEQVLLKSINTREPNTIISTINWVVGTALNKDLRNLYNSIIESLIKPELFDDGRVYDFETGNPLFNDTITVKRFNELISSLTKSQKPPKGLSVNYHNFIYALLVKLGDAFETNCNHLQVAIEEELTRIYGTANFGLIAVSAIQEIMVSLKLFSRLKNGLLVDFNKHLFEGVMTKHLEPLEMAGLHNATDAEMEILPDLPTKLHAFFHLFSVYLSKESFERFRASFLKFLAQTFLLIAHNKRYNYTGTCVLKKEYSRLQPFFIDSETEIEENDQCKMTFEILNAYDKEEFEGIADVYIDKLSPKQLEEIKSLRTDFN